MQLFTLDLQHEMCNSYTSLRSSQLPPFVSAGEFPPVLWLFLQLFKRQHKLEQWNYLGGVVFSLVKFTGLQCGTTEGWHHSLVADWNGNVNEQLRAGRKIRNLDEFWYSLGMSRPGMID